MIDWLQLGADFQQKYQDTFCRYVSPVTYDKDVFYISKVYARDYEPPHITLYSKKHGELYLKYTTEAELDFTFPRCGYFAYQGKALLFSRLFGRQWKKGVCAFTANITFPYPGHLWGAKVDEDILRQAFGDRHAQSFTQAAQQLKDDDLLSVPVSDTLALGLGKKNELWVWYETDLIGELSGSTLTVKTPEFKQEILDHIRDTGDHAIKVV